MGKKDRMRYSLGPKFFARAFDDLEPNLKRTGDKIAGDVAGYEADSMIKRDRNGRPVALVALKHPNGRAIEAKHGTLSRAARRAGAHYHPYGGR